MTAASVPTGTKRCCEIQGQERHQGNPAELTPKRYPNTTNRQGVVCPVRDYYGAFPSGSMAVFFLKIAPKHDTKNRYPPISTVTAEMGGFSMIGGTMPRMSKKRKLELSFFLNDRGRVTYNDLCRKCQHECKQSFRAVVIDCPRYLSKRAKRKEKTD